MKYHHDDDGRKVFQYVEISQLNDDDPIFIEAQ